MELTQQLALALGLPKNCISATLHLRAGEPPRLDVECFLTDGMGRVVLDTTAEYGEPVHEEIKRIAFSYRLVPFGER